MPDDVFFFAGCPGLRLGWSSFTFVQLMFFGRHGDGVLTCGEKLTWSWLGWRSQADDLHVERPDSHLDHLGLAGVLLVTCGRLHKIPSQFQHVSTVSLNKWNSSSCSLRHFQHYCCSRQFGELDWWHFRGFQNGSAALRILCRWDANGIPHNPR